MKNNEVNIYIAANAKYFPTAKIPYLKEKLYEADEEKFKLVTNQQMKEPIAMLVISVLFGYTGVDRFMLGDIWAGFFKTMTCGGCLAFTIVDWFLIVDRTKEINYENMMKLL